MIRGLTYVSASVMGLGILFAGNLAAQNPSSAAPVTTVSSVTKVAPGNATLPSTKEVMDKYEAAIGGRKVWSNFTTRYMRGLYQTEDTSGFAEIEIFSKAPNKTLFKITFSNGLVIREVCDGKAAWIEDPAGGMHPLAGPALESRIRESNFNDRADALLMAVSGHLLGTDKVGIHNAYVLEFSPAKKITSKIYFDMESGLAVRTDDTLHRAEGDYTVENFLDDYRAVDGAYFPFRLRHVEKGNVFTLRFTQIKNNYPVDDTMFLEPASALR
jgi:hypothetical protein